jgi:hypothetical protein
MSAIPSTSGSLHSEFVCFLFLQVHRETDRFFSTSGVQIPQHSSGFFHFLRETFSSHIKYKVDNILTKAAALRIVLNIDGAPIDPSVLAFSLASHRYSS